jgi:hypothetical protein
MFCNQNDAVDQHESTLFNLPLDKIHTKIKLHFNGKSKGLKPIK